MMTANHFCRNSLLRTALALLFSAAACTASAQVIPAFSAIGNVSAFGTFTTVKPDYGYYGDPRSTESHWEVTCKRGTSLA